MISELADERVDQARDISETRRQNHSPHHSSWTSKQRQVGLSLRQVASDKFMEEDPAMLEYDVMAPRRRIGIALIFLRWNAVNFKIGRLLNEPAGCWSWPGDEGHATIVILAAEHVLRWLLF